MKNRVARFLLVAVIVLAAPALIFAGAAAEGGTTGPIKIGVAGPYTGDLASYGIPSARAAELVVDMWNAKGGVLGRQIELVVEAREDLGNGRGVGSGKLLDLRIYVA